MIAHQKITIVANVSANRRKLFAAATSLRNREVFSTNACEQRYQHYRFPASELNQAAKLLKNLPVC